MQREDNARIRALVAAKLPPKYEPLLLTFYGHEARVAGDDVIIGDDYGTELHLVPDGSIVSIDPEGRLPRENQRGRESLIIARLSIIVFSMPRRLRVSTGGLLYHVLNRAAGRERLFKKPEDFLAMLRVIDETHARLPIRIVSYCLMSNHWHFVLWPEADGQLSEFMRLLTVTHTQRWHAHHHTAGTGPLYQGRFKSFPIQQDEHFLAVCRYVEQNPLRAGMVKSAGDWRWGSFSARREKRPPSWLLPMDHWPIAAPTDWSRRVNRTQGTAELEAVRLSVRRGRPFGEPSRQIRTAAKLSLQSTLRPRGRQRIRPIPEIKDSRPL
jgi:putative transposase